jgi:hypothetical protein
MGSPRVIDARRRDHQESAVIPLLIAVSQSIFGKIDTRAERGRRGQSAPECD